METKDMETKDMEIVQIPLDEIDADDEFNCRGSITPMDVRSLADNIQKLGLLQAGVVMPHPNPSSGYKYKLIAGYRRRYAVKLLGHKTFSCYIKEDINEEDAMFLNLNENIQRQQLSILQEAKAIAKIKVHNPKANRAYCAKALGMGEGWVQIREYLLNLPPEVQQEVNAGLITQAQIRELNNVIRHEGKERCYEVAKEMKKAKLAGRKPRIKMKKNRDAKRERKRTEIFDMMADINDSIPYKSHDGTYYLWAKTMSWCAGEISDNDLFEACKQFCEDNGHNWSAPDCDA